MQNGVVSHATAKKIKIKRPAFFDVSALEYALVSLLN